MVQKKKKRNAFFAFLQFSLYRNLKRSGNSLANLLIVGSLNMDTVISVEHIPKQGETILAEDISFHPGGKGANQAYAAGKLGARVSMIGCVGKDANGRNLLNNLLTAQVDIQGISIDKNHTTGSAFITVDKKGENSIVVVPGANMAFSKEEIDKNKDLIAWCDAVIAQLEIPVETVSYLAEITKSMGKRMILDPAPARADLPEAIYSFLDVIKPNETELQILTGKPTNTEEEIFTAAQCLLEKGVAKVVVTLGEKGAMLVDRDVYQIFPPRKVTAVDTTAAGDAFIAAFAMKLVESGSYEKAVSFGNLVSSMVVTKKGAQSSIPTSQEVEEKTREISECLFRQ